MVTRHHPQMTEDGLMCRCGSEGCIALSGGVWTPSRRITTDERAEAIRTFAAPAAMAWVGAMVEQHRGHGGKLVAEHDVDTSLYWSYVPRDDA